MVLKRNRCILFASVVLGVLLSGCVTTERGGFDKAKTVDEAVAVRVHAAKQYLASRDFASAKRHLKSALELDDKSADVHDALALTFGTSGELELADSPFRKAITYGNGGSRYRMNYASFLFRQQKFSAAEKQLEHIADDSLYERRESALILLGLTHLQVLEVKKARQSFEKALVLNPNNQMVLRELSILNYESGEYEQAWRYFQRFRDITAQPGAEMLLLGIQLANQLGDEEARQNYLLALKNLYPDSREYQSYLRDMQHKNSAN